MVDLDLTSIPIEAGQSPDISPELGFLYQALESERGIALPFSDKKSAEAYRFRLYNARKGSPALEQISISIEDPPAGGSTLLKLIPIKHPSEVIVL